MSQALVRPRSNRVIAGVCAAVANRYGWNITAVRVLTVVGALIFGSGLLIYIVLWIVIPQDAAA